MDKEIMNAPLEGTVCNIKVAPDDHLHAGQAILGIRDSHMLHLIVADVEQATG